MGTWNGFTTDLLKAAHLSTAQMTVQFMFDWNTAATSDCRNNPVDISHTVRGSSNCHRLTSTRVAQNYATTQMASTSFATEIHSGNFSHLLAALGTDNPYSYSDPAGVESDLRKWGSPGQAAYYAKNATGGTPTTQNANDPHAHTAWVDLQRSVNKRWPANIKGASQSRRAALRNLARAHRVRV